MDGVEPLAVHLVDQMVFDEIPDPESLFRITSYNVCYTKLLRVVTGVGFLIHVYSVGYMSHDRAFARYFVYLNLFTFAMLLLVLGSNFLLMFVGWEGVGLCSYLLIGFWYAKGWPAEAGQKAFVVNRIV